MSSRPNRMIERGVIIEKNVKHWHVIKYQLYFALSRAQINVHCIWMNICVCREINICTGLLCVCVCAVQYVYCSVLMGSNNNVQCATNGCLQTWRSQDGNWTEIIKFDSVGHSSCSVLCGVVACASLFAQVLRPSWRGIGWVCGPSIVCKQRIHPFWV